VQREMCRAGQERPVGRQAQRRVEPVCTAPAGAVGQGDEREARQELGGHLARCAVVGRDHERAVLGRRGMALHHRLQRHHDVLGRACRRQDATDDGVREVGLGEPHGKDGDGRLLQ